MTALHSIAFALAAGATAACGSGQLEPLPLEITITADRLTAARGDSISFDVRAQGGALRILSVDWGDGDLYTVLTSGARTAHAIVRHAYANAGMYDVEAAVDDAQAGRKAATVRVTVQ